MIKPMKAFKIEGDNGYIELAIDGAPGYPNQKREDGGYDLTGNLVIKVSGYAAKSRHYFTSKQLEAFYSSLKECSHNISGTAVLDSGDGALKISCVFDPVRGHVRAVGRFQVRPDVNNALDFEIRGDQTRVNKPLAQLKKALKAFAENK